MAENSAIEWTDHTFNPWIGCTKVGPGCDNCYAADLSRARLGVPWGPGQPRRHTAASTWKQPRAWNNRAARLGIRYRVFCASLADVFDNEVPAEWRADLFALIRETPHLDWLLVTKRIGNAAKMAEAAGGWPVNVWLGATIVNQAEAERDIPKLLAFDGGPLIRFLSMEPLLGPVDLSKVRWHVGGYPMEGALPTPGEPDDFIYWAHQYGIAWVIVGGESGPHARPMHPDWARSLRDQCAAAGVPFLFKQWGEHSLSYDRDRDDPDWRRCSDQERTRGQWLNLAGGTGFHGERVHYAARVGKKAAGRLLDGVQHDGVPGNA